MPSPFARHYPDHVFTTVALNGRFRSAGKRPMLFPTRVMGPGGSLFLTVPATSLVCLPPGSVDRYIADSIYSHPLTQPRKQAKHLAVEAMHAVRDYADGEPTTVLKTLRSIRNDSSLPRGVDFNPRVTFGALHDHKRLSTSCAPRC